MDLSLIIPCFNESDGLAQLRTQLEPVIPALAKRWGRVELVLVDDGSVDDTYEQMQTHFGSWPNVQFARHERNRGLGAALRTGFAASSGRVVVVTDSDCTYPMDTIPKLLDKLGPGIDIVTSSCYHPQGRVDGVPAYRIFLSRGASLLYRILVSPRIYTWTAMYRAYRREVVDAVPTVSTGYLVMAELLVGAILRGYKVAEYPTVLRVRQYGQSKAKIKQIIRAHLAFQGQIAQYRLGLRKDYPRAD